MSFSDSSFLSFPRLRFERPTIAIVGGNAGGVAIATHLLRDRAPVRIVLVGEHLRLDGLQDDVAAARRRTPFTALRAQVVGIAAGPDGAGLQLDGGDTLWASQVVLAVENRPLAAGLFACGDARPGPGALGLDVDADGRILGRAGEASDVLWAVGSPQQATAVARLLPDAALAVEIAYALEEAY